MNPFYQLLLEIKRNPKQYIDTASLEHLNHFIHGYESVLFDYTMPRESTFFQGFTNYISNLYQESYAIHWTTILSLFSQSDESAFHLFFQHLEEYIDTKDLRKELEQWHPKEVSDESTL